MTCEVVSTCENIQHPKCGKVDKLKHIHNSQQNNANSYNPVGEAVAEETHLCPGKQNIKNNTMVMISSENERTQFKE